jgi:Tfp pilus assembly protein FimT
MRIRKQQSGFAIVELAIVVVIVAAIVVIGLWVHNRSKTTTANTLPTNSTQSPVANNVSTAPAISKASDLDSALDTLNQNDPGTANGSDSSQLNSQTSTF